MGDVIDISERRNTREWRVPAEWLATAELYWPRTTDKEIFLAATAFERFPANNPHWAPTKDQFLWFCRGRFTGPWE